MDIQERVEILIRYIKSSKRKIYISALIASIVAVLLFIFGSYYLLFHYYEGIVRDYYSSFLRDVYSFQQRLIAKETYREDLKQIAHTVKEQKGVEHVWVTDRFGRLIYSTDDKLFAEYSGKRLPANYFESIQHLWSFENGYPKAKIVPIKRLFSLRLSIPIYAYGHEDYDFILGADVKRFIYLPDRISFLLPVSLGYIVVFVALLFLPIFLWVRSGFSTLSTQARVLGGSIQFDLEKVTSEIPKHEEAKEEAAFEEKEEVEREKEEKEEIKPVEEEEIKEEKEEKEEERVAVATEERDVLSEFMEKKLSVFKKQEIDLPFLQASSFVFHSNVLEGSYFYYHKNDSNDFYISFNYPFNQLENAVNKTEEIVEYFDIEMNKTDQIKEITKGFNTYCLQNNMDLDLSMVKIDEAENRVDFISFGKGYSIYLKHNEEKGKELMLDIPRLGTISEEDFKERVSYAEIKFVKDDLFILLPQNISDIVFNDERFIDLIQRVMLVQRDHSALDIGSEINKVLEPFFRKESKLPQTGFIVLKFL